MFTKYLKYKYFLLLLVLVFITFFNLFSFNYFIKNYEQLESEKNVEKLSYIINTINTQYNNINSIVKDYAHWDSTYIFIEDKNSNFINDNFRDENIVLENLNLDFMIFMDNKSNIIFSAISKNIEKNQKEELLNIIAKMQKENLENKIMKFENNYFLICKEKIIKSDLTGEKRGFLYGASILNLQNLNKLYGDSIKILDKSINIDSSDSKEKSFTPIKVGLEIDDTYLKNYIILKNNKEETLLTLKFETQRELYIKARNDILFFNFIISILSFIMFLIFQKLISYQNRVNLKLEKKVQEGVKKQREQEQILIQQSKLASMGEMIGNIAHQWRQPLNALNLTIQNIDFAYKADELNDAFMEKAINKSNILINTMSQTIDDFRNFFKPNKKKELFDVNLMIRSCIEILSPTFNSKNIKIIKELSLNNPQILNLKNELSQVILIILSNAKDALINDKIENPEIVVKSYEQYDFLIISIKDNAKGINEDIKDKIFEPYFTTKSDANGTGIGLYMAKIIVEKNMQGKLSVISSTDGSEFVIQLEKI